MQFNQSYHKIGGASESDLTNKETEPFVCSLQPGMIENGILTDTGQQKSSSKTSSKKPNMFDTLLKHTTSSSDLRSEIDHYLATNTEAVTNPLGFGR